MALVLDAGALIAFDRGDRRVAALIAAAQRRREPVVTSSGCVAQAWRGGGYRQALLARLLGGVREQGLDVEVSRAIGELCAANGSSDVVDAHLALVAGAGDVVVTSVDDLRALLDFARTGADVVRC